MSAPLQRLIPKGAVNQSLHLRVQNQISFVAQTSFMPSAAGLIIKYHRLGDPTQDAGGVSVALTSIANLSVPHTDGAVIPVWDGFIRVDVPDAAFAKVPGCDQVLITLSATAVISPGCLVQLTDGDQVTSATPKVY